VGLGRPDDARRLLQHLEWRGRTLPRAWIDARLPRARATVRAAEGRPDLALAILDAAPAVPGLPFEAARSLLVRGQLERRVKRKLAARASLADALRVFEELGSPPWAQRTRDEIARLGLRHRTPGELTETERRIGELAASGMTNREVADAAFVSPKTVEANLARVYRKLGIRSRAELGARMASGDAPDGQT
jgi:DNA-binding CsgD family transcriptional regulator